MRRSLVLIPTTLIGLLLMAAPALAAEKEAAASEGDLALGLILALVIGSVMGLVVFIDANAGGEGEDLPAPPREH